MNLEAVEDAADADDTPGVAFGLISFSRRWHGPFKSHEPVLRIDANARRVHQRILVERLPHGIGDQLVAVILGRPHGKLVDDVAGPRNLPGEDARQPLLREARNLAFQRDDALPNLEVDSPDDRTAASAAS